jgi:type I restriction enzyme M protein
MRLTDILKDSNYKLTQFENNDQQKIKFLEQILLSEKAKGKSTAYVNCLVRKKEIRLTA